MLRDCQRESLDLAWMWKTGEEDRRFMAQYQILYWRHIPLGVKATDLNGTVRENLPPRFQEAIDRLATQDGENQPIPRCFGGARLRSEREPLLRLPSRSPPSSTPNGLVRFRSNHLTDQ